MREMKLQDLKSKTPAELVAFAEEHQVENAEELTPVHDEDDHPDQQRRRRKARRGGADDGDSGLAGSDEEPHALT